MTTLPADDALPMQQREVQRLLGRCLLRLQQYEKLMKAIVAHHEISAAGSPLASNQEQRIADAASKTLGTLVGTLLGAYVTTDEVEDASEPDARDDIISFKVKMSLRMSAEDYDRTQNDLKELVLVRNNLVHHFIDQHDLWSLDGCRGAHDTLTVAYGRIDQRFEQLRGWAEHMDQARRLAAEFAQSDAFHDLVIHGIAPDGSVDWSSRAGRRLPRQDAGSQSGSLNTCPPSTAAAVGGRSCTNLACSSFDIVMRAASARLGIGPNKHSASPAHTR
jgi:hypothetical protein